MDCHRIAVLYVLHSRLIHFLRGRNRWVSYTEVKYIFSPHFFGPLHAEFKNIPDHGVLLR